jgi:hypothetical protein
LSETLANVFRRTYGRKLHIVAFVHFRFALII